MNFFRIILFISIISAQDFHKIQIIADYEMNMSWLSPNLPDSSFFTSDSFNYAGFSTIATDCYDNEIDYFEPPPLVDDWCRFAFPHDDNGINECWYNELGLNLFTQDIRHLDEQQLDNQSYEWDIEFSAGIPGYASIYILNDNLEYPCNYYLEMNSEVYGFGINDTVNFWYYSFTDPPIEIKLTIGDCVIFGNVNMDNEINVIDILFMIDIIMGEEFSDNQMHFADIDHNGIVNVNDIVMVVQMILE